MTDSFVIGSDHGVQLGLERLHSACATFGVEWSSFEPFVEVFGPQLTNHCECSIEPHIGSLSLRTRGDGQVYGYRVARYMEAHGIPEPALERFWMRSKYFDYQNLLFKTEADIRGVRECSTLYECAPSIQMTHAMLSDVGVAVDSIGLMEAVAEVLGEQAVVGMGTAASCGGYLMDQVFFSCLEVPRIWDRCHSVATLCGLSDADWAPMASIRTQLEHSSVRVSLSFLGESVMPGLQIDVHDAPVFRIGGIVDRLRTSTSRPFHAQSRPGSDGLC